MSAIARPHATMRALAISAMDSIGFQPVRCTVGWALSNADLLCRSRPSDVVGRSPTSQVVRPKINSKHDLAEMKDNGAAHVRHLDTVAVD